MLESSFNSNSSMATCLRNHLLYFLLAFLCFVQNGGAQSFYTISNLSISDFKLKPYHWKYFRVDLPLWFSSVTITLESDVYLNPPQEIKKEKRSRLPIICLRDGGLPLPDVNEDFSGLVSDPLPNGSFGNLQGLHNAELCYPVQRNMILELTNEQILPGVWYWGLFYGIGPERTQAKMIDRGKVYTIAANVRTEGCNFANLGGRNCDQMFIFLKCADKDVISENQTSLNTNEKEENLNPCGNFRETSCYINGEPEIYALEIKEIIEQIVVKAKSVQSSRHGFVLRCYARYGAIPLARVYDYSANISKGPLYISFPRVGRWYFSIYLENQSSVFTGVRDTSTEICYSLKWQAFQCPQGKAGLNCTSDMFQTVLEKDHKYMPQTETISAKSAEFPLDPFFINEQSESDWVYFLLDVPHGGSGENLLIQLACDVKINYDVYMRYGGLPSLDNWDCFYANLTSSCYGSVYSKLYSANEKLVTFYILQVREGNWSIGFRRINPGSSGSNMGGSVMISLDGCPMECGGTHGTCHHTEDSVTDYSYCLCDKQHGGFDCGVVVVSHLGQVWQTILLVGSNGAALLPALWSLHQKAYAEWVLFTLSGVSSAIYHACDVGTICLSTFDILKFMDFWLSAVAVVYTVVYMIDVGEASKGAIRTGLLITSVLVFESGSTIDSHVAAIVGIWAASLLFGWLINFVTLLESCTPSRGSHQNLNNWCALLKNFMQGILQCFRWRLFIVAFVALLLAKMCWEFEDPEEYWIWHSLWHISIFMSAFLFLCSRAIPVKDRNEILPFRT